LNMCVAKPTFFATVGCKPSAQNVAHSNPCKPLAG
jgi:hypothetical protein